MQLLLMAKIKSWKKNFQSQSLNKKSDTFKKLKLKSRYDKNRLWVEGGGG